MQNKISQENLVAALSELFPVQEQLVEMSDLAKYIKDSIDLGELVAVIKERHGVTPKDMQLFKTHTRLGDVLKIFNHEFH